MLLSLLILPKRNIALPWLLILPAISLCQTNDTRLDSTYYYQYTSAIDSFPTQKKVCTYSSLANSSDCYNFSSCVSSSWDTQTRLWTPYSKIDTRTEETGKKITRLGYSWIPGSKRWLLEQKSYEVNLDTESERNTYILDKPTGIFQHVDAFRRQLDANGNELLFQSKTYHHTDEVWEGIKQENTYDEENRLITFSGYEWDHEQNAWIGQARFTQTYTPTGKLEKKAHSFWVEDSKTWLDAWTESYTYNAKDQLIQKLQENGISVDKFVFSYNDQGREIFWQRSFQSGPNFDLIPVEKVERNYDMAGNEIDYRNYHWNADTAIWELRERIVQSYNGQNQVIETKNSDWNDEADSLYLRQIQTLSYTPQGHLERRESLTYSPEGDVRYGNQTLLSYDPAGKTIGRIRANWNIEKEDWEYLYRIETPYTSSGWLKSYAWYDWDSDQEKWIGRNKSAYGYDAQGLRVWFSQAFWRETKEDWFITSSRTTAFGPCRRETVLPGREGALVLYPNPLQAPILQVEAELNRPFKYEILNTQGQKVLQGEMHALVNSLDLENLVNGTYILHCFDGSQVETQKFIISRP